MPTKKYCQSNAKYVNQSLLRSLALFDERADGDDDGIRGDDGSQATDGDGDDKEA